jgi:hypothetical protein
VHLQEKMSQETTARKTRTHMGTEAKSGVEHETGPGVPWTEGDTWWREKETRGRRRRGNCGSQRQARPGGRVHGTELRFEPDNMRRRSCAAGDSEEDRRT